jgi:hypothetical protein
MCLLWTQKLFLLSHGVVGVGMVGSHPVFLSSSLHDHGLVPMLFLVSIFGHTSLFLVLGFFVFFSNSLPPSWRRRNIEKGF